jgi:Tol biopolymer transport system component
MRRWWSGGRRVFGVALVVLAGWVCVSDAAFPGRDGRIAFVWNAPTRGRSRSCVGIFSIKPNGDGRRRLTRGCPSEYSPGYSASGKQIVFVGGGTVSHRDHGPGIYVMDANGSHVRRITASPNDADPSLSPSGRWVVFDRYLKRSWTTQIFLASVRGADVQQLTHRANGAADPTFSPNGRTIAFVADYGHSIHTMRPDGSHMHRLAHLPVRSFDFYEDPDYSPNGRLILLICGIAPGLGTIAQVCDMRSDGKHLKHLTPGGRADPIVLGAAFSPNSRRIAFVALKNNSNSAFLYTIDKNGTHLHQLFDLGPHQNQTPLGVTWQPLP